MFVQSLIPPIFDRILPLRFPPLVPLCTRLWYLHAWSPGVGSSGIGGSKGRGSDTIESHDPDRQWKPGASRTPDTVVQLYQSGFRVLKHIMTIDSSIDTVF